MVGQRRSSIVMVRRQSPSLPRPLLGRPEARVSDAHAVCLSCRSRRSGVRRNERKQARSVAEHVRTAGGEVYSGGSLSLNMGSYRRRMRNDEMEWRVATTRSPIDGRTMPCLKTRWESRQGRDNVDMRKSSVCLCSPFNGRLSLGGRESGSSRARRPSGGCTRHT